MKTLKLYSVPNTNIANSDNYDELRKFADMLGHSDIKIEEVQRQIFETGDKVKVSKYSGGSQDTDGITTGGKLVDFTGTIRVENNNTAFLTDENGKTISISPIVSDENELVETTTKEEENSNYKIVIGDTSPFGDESEKFISYLNNLGHDAIIAPLHAHTEGGNTVDGLIPDNDECPLDLGQLWSDYCNS